MPFDPTQPAHGSPKSSLVVRNQLNALKALIDAQAAVIATLEAQLAALQTQLANEPGRVPIGAAVPWFKDLPGVPVLPASFVECNGQVLNDPASPLHGQTIPNINGEQRFLRGAAASGDVGGATMHSHGFNGGDSAAAGTDLSFALNQFPGTTDTEHLPPWMDAVFVMRVR